MKFLQFLLSLCLFCFVVSGQSQAQDLLQQLQQAKAMLEQGLISEDEYNRTKKNILGRLSGGSGQAATPSGGMPSGAVDLQPSHRADLAVIPFYGKVYSDGDRDSVAKFSVENMRRYIESSDVSLPGGILDFHEVKQLILHHIGILDPDQPYSNEQLQKIARILGVRYLAFGEIRHLSFTQQVHRFNVMCMVYDAANNKIVFERQARQSTARKWLNMLLPEKGKTFGKISEQFYFFLDEL